MKWKLEARGLAHRVALGVALALAGALPVVQAAVITEFEPNDSVAGAQVISATDTVLQINGARTFADPSDDFFRFQVRRGGLISISSTSTDGAADSILGLYDPLGNLVASNDDGGAGFMSALDYLVSESDVGWFTLGFSGFNPGLISCTPMVTSCYDTDGDFVFDTFVAGGGPGGSTGWDYQITVSGAGLVPLPGTLALLAFGLPLLLKRRHRT